MTHGTAGCVSGLALVWMSARWKQDRASGYCPLETCVFALNRLRIGFLLEANRYDWRLTMETKTSFSLQARLIRQMQEDEGQTVCYASPDAMSSCTNKNCCWRHDCFEETADQACTEYVLQG